jgi:hypothetical protein
MTNDILPPATIRRRRLQLLLVALFFFGPLAVAFYMYYGGIYLPHGRVNHGTLISPARHLDDRPLLDGAGSAPKMLLGKWSLLYIVGDTCDAACHRVLAMMRAERLALGRDADRVQRVIVMANTCCDRSGLSEDEVDVRAVWLAPTERDRWLAEFPGEHGSVVYVIDPLGNLMMSYPVDGDQKGLLIDLQRLLRLSHIG